MYKIETDLIGGRRVYARELPGASYAKRPNLVYSRFFMEGDHAFRVWKQCDLKVAGILRWEIIGAPSINISSVITVVESLGSLQPQLGFYLKEPGQQPDFFGYNKELITEIRDQFAFFSKKNII